MWTIPARSRARPGPAHQEPRGGTDYIEADLNDPGALVSIARTKLDFAQPVAIMLMGVMGHIGTWTGSGTRCPLAATS
jgi:hypothetical protein